MTTYANTCVFCQRNDSPPSSEHILATWITKAFPEVQEFLITDNLAGRRFGAKKQLGMISNRVCLRCNTIWMRKLEDKAKPILLPMIKGESVSLNKLSQFTICLWFLKTAMMLERRGKGPYFFTDEDRKKFAETFHISPRLSLLMFLGRYISDNCVTARDGIVPLHIFPNSPRAIPINGYTATLTIKQLAIQFIIGRFPLHAPMGVTTRIPKVVETIQIWPITEDRTWPPSESFGDEVLNDFIERLNKAEE